MSPAKFLKWLVLLVIAANLVIVAVVFLGGHKKSPEVPRNPVAGTNAVLQSSSGQAPAAPTNQSPR